LDANQFSFDVEAGDGTAFELAKAGGIWQLTDGGPVELQTGINDLGAIAPGANAVFRVDEDGTIWQWNGTPCGQSPCFNWTGLDTNPAARAISAGGSLFQLHSDGSIWRFTGTACSSAGCPGWVQLDNNPAATAIAASVERELSGVSAAGGRTEARSAGATVPDHDGRTPFSFRAMGGRARRSPRPRPRRTVRW
jgi:hypothetical protein